jgi:hypothetical protein
VSCIRGGRDIAAGTVRPGAACVRGPSRVLRFVTGILWRIAIVYTIVIWLVWLAGR